MKVAMRLSPQPPSWYTYALALAEIWAGDLAAAERAAEENMRVEGEDPTAHVNLATVYSLQGRGKDARRVVAEMRELAPAYSIANILRSERYREPEKLARVIGILREAGLPE
jgi:Flp pilus assembly protein TadD